MGAIVEEQQESRYRFALNKARDRQRHPVNLPGSRQAPPTLQAAAHRVTPLPETISPVNRLKNTRPKTFK
jgi:hypothetical protein